MIDYKTVGAKIRELCSKLKGIYRRINALSCSADELLCDEPDRAEYTYISALAQILEDCSSHELRMIADTIQALTSSLHK